MTGTMAFGLGLGTGMVVTTVTILVTLGRLGKSKLVRKMKEWEQRQARGRAIAAWDEDFPDVVLCGISRRTDDTPRDGLDTWGFVG